jgi:hypothetical protein
VNHVKVGPVNDKGKYMILNASSADASPSCIKYRAICSTVLVSSCPENFVKSAGAFTLCGKATLYIILGKEVCTHALDSWFLDLIDFVTHRSFSVLEDQH